MKRFYKLITLSVLVFVGMTNLYAQHFINSTATSGSNNSFPMNTTTSNRVQWLIKAGEFSGAYSGYITDVYLMSGTTVTSSSFTNLTIQLGHNSTTGLSTGAWITTGMQTCYYAATTNFGSVTAGTFYKITLQTPFMYDPTQNLILDVSQSAYTGGRTTIQFTPGSGNRRAWGPVSGTASTGSDGACAICGIDMMPAAGFDLAMIAIKSPLSLATGNNTLTVTVQNKKVDTIKWFDIAYQVDNNTPIVATNQYPSTPISAGKTYDYTFSTPFNIPSSGTYKIKTWVANTNDSVPDNEPKNDTFVQYLCTGLTGNYTIGGTGADYPTFNSAVNAMLTCGVAGPVVFNVAATTFNERITLPEVLGMSATNTVAFIGSGISSTTLTSAGSSTSDWWTVLFNGGDYFTFKHMKIANTGSSYGSAIIMTNNSEANTIDSCRLEVPQTTSYYNCNIIATASLTSYSSYGNTANHNTFSNNTMFGGGYYSVRFNGTSSSSLIVGNKFINNTIAGAYSYGMYMYYAGEGLYKNNYVGQLLSTSGYGMYIYYGTKDLVDGNIVQAPYIGIYLSYQNGYFTGNTSQFINNMISGFTYSAAYGVYSYYCTNVDYYHNTIWVRSPSSNSVSYAALNLYYSNYCKVKNNVLINDSPNGSLIYKYYGTWNNGDIDYNDYYGNPYYGLNENGTIYSNLASWQTAMSGMGFDQNSWSQDPGLVSYTDLHYTGLGLLMWAPNVGIDHDVDNEVRTTTGNVIISADQPLPMVYDSVTFVHVADTVAFVSQNNVKLSKVWFYTRGALDAPGIQNAWFTLQGTTSLSDIERVKFYRLDKKPLQDADVFYTIERPTSFNLHIPFDTTANINTCPTIVVAVDLRITAQAGNFLDATLDSIEVDHIVRYPVNGNPAGNTEIIIPANYNLYCDVTRGTVANAAIGTKRVKFESIDNYTNTLSSGIGSTNTVVQFYSNNIPTVYKKKTYPLTVKFGELNAQSAVVFFDINNDGYFENWERVAQWLNQTEGSSVTSNITIPCEAADGWHRARIVSDFASYTPVACGVSNYGEAEDYLIYVHPEDTPVVSISHADTAYLNGLTQFTANSNMDGDILYIWDFDSDSNPDDTAAVGEYYFTSTGTKAITLTAVLYGCKDTIVSQPAYSTIPVIVPPSKPQVNFISNINTVTSSIPVYFTDLSTLGPYKWHWDIQPEMVLGSPAYTILPSADAREPMVQFHALGNYSVKLVATNDVGSDSLVKADYITVVDELKMCTDASSNLRSGYIYDDGGKFGNYTNPSVGLQKKCYFLIKPKCASSVTLDFLDFDMTNLTISTCPTLPGDNIKVYDGVDTNGTPLHLQFKDMLGGAIYPNGFTNGPNPIPPSVTANSGSLYIEYFVNCGAVGTGFEAQWSTVVYTPPMPVAMFEAPDTIYTDQTVYYKNTSTGVELDYQWDLTGDGFIDDLTFEPSFKYTTDGVYTIKLIANSCDYIDTFTKTLVVLKPTKKPNVDFYADFTKVTVADLVTLIDNSDKTVYEREWTITPTNFDITATGNELVTVSGKFNAIGYYDVKLVAENSFGSDSVTKTAYILVYKQCAPNVGILSSDVGITEVLLTNSLGDTLISQTSSAGVKAYYDYSNEKRATVAKDGTYTLTMKRNSNFNKITRSVFIDLNQNGDFDDAGEEVAMDFNASTLSWTTDLTIPNNIPDGLYKMRLATNAGQLKNKGCGPNYSGEFEDYGLVITKDVYKPLITLIGGNSVISNSCESFVDPGYTAFDVEAGDLTKMVVRTGTIDSTKAGIYELHYNVTDPAGNKADEVIRKVEVLPDIIKPTITLSGNNPEYVPVFGSYTDPGYTATDNCSGIKSYSSVSHVNTNYVGHYQINYTAEDNAGNILNIARDVYVYDKVDPNISLNGTNPIYIEVGTPFTDPGAYASDNYDLNPTYTVTGTVNTNVIGTYFLSYCVTDSSGNGPICVDRDVIVQDNTAPTITILGDNPYTLEVHQNFNDPGVDVTDNYYGESEILIFTSGKVDNYLLGSYTIDYKAVDGSGNQSAIVSRTVTVVDLVEPVIELDGPSVYVVERWKEFKEPGVKISDNYYEKADLTVNYNVNGNYPGNTLELGLYSYTYNVCDPSNNCSDDIVRTIYVVPSTSSLEDNDALSNLRYYPNPANKEVTIELDLPAYLPVSIAIYNSLGQKVMNIAEGNLSHFNDTINVEHLASGLYYIRFSAGDQQVNNKLIISR